MLFIHLLFLLLIHVHSHRSPLTHISSEYKCGESRDRSKYIVNVWNEETDRFFLGVFITETHVITGAHTLKNGDKFVDPSSLFLIPMRDMKYFHCTDRVGRRMVCPKDHSTKRFGIRVRHYAIRAPQTINHDLHLTILETEPHGRRFYTCLDSMSTFKWTNDKEIFTSTFVLEKMRALHFPITVVGLNENEPYEFEERCTPNDMCEQTFTVNETRSNVYDTYSEILTTERLIDRQIKNVMLGVRIDDKTVISVGHSQFICFNTGVCQPNQTIDSDYSQQTDGKHSSNQREPFCPLRHKEKLLEHSSFLTKSVPETIINIRRTCGIPEMPGGYINTMLPFVGSLIQSGDWEVTEATHPGARAFKELNNAAVMYSRKIICSGVLISDRHVITSASCIQNDINDGSNLFVAFPFPSNNSLAYKEIRPVRKYEGKWKDDEMPHYHLHDVGTLWWTVKRFVVPHCSANKCNKIAIAELSYPVNFMETHANVRPICLSDSDQDLSDLFVAASNESSTLTDDYFMAKVVHFRGLFTRKVACSNGICTINASENVNGAPVIVQRNGFFELFGIAGERNDETGLAPVMKIRPYLSFICMTTGVFPVSAQFNVIRFEKHGIKDDRPDKILELESSWDMDNCQTMKSIEADERLKSQRMNILSREENNLVNVFCKKRSTKHNRMALIRYSSDDNEDVLASGVFISTRHVLSDGFMKGKELKPSELSLHFSVPCTQENCEKPRINRKSSIKFIVTISTSDIVILELTSDEFFTQEDIPICLPRPNESFETSNFTFLSYDNGVTSKAVPLNPVRSLKTGETEPDLSAITTNEFLEQADINGKPIMASNVEFEKLWGTVTRINGLGGEKGYSITSIKQFVPSICRVTGVCPDEYMERDENKVPKISANGEELCRF